MGMVAHFMMMVGTMTKPMMMAMVAIMAMVFMMLLAGTVMMVIVRGLVVVAVMMMTMVTMVASTNTLVINTMWRVEMAMMGTAHRIVHGRGIPQGMHSGSLLSLFGWMDKSACCVEHVGVGSGQVHRVSQPELDPNIVRHPDNTQTTAHAL